MPTYYLEENVVITFWPPDFRALVQLPGPVYMVQKESLAFFFVLAAERERQVAIITLCELNGYYTRSTVITAK